MYWRGKERCRSLISALTRSPVSAACAVQTCFTSIADSKETTKRGNTFDSVLELLWRVYLFSVHLEPEALQFSISKRAICSQSRRLTFKKAVASSGSVSHTFWHLGYICFVSGCDSSGLTYLTHRDWHWVTGVVKTASVTSNTRQHINQCVSGLKKCRLDIKYNYYHLIKQKCQFTGQ